MGKGLYYGFLWEEMSKAGQAADHRATLFEKFQWALGYRVVPSYPVPGCEMNRGEGYCLLTLKVRQGGGLEHRPWTGQFAYGRHAYRQLACCLQELANPGRGYPSPVHKAPRYQSIIKIQIIKDIFNTQQQQANLPHTDFLHQGTRKGRYSDSRRLWSPPGSCGQASELLQCPDHCLVSAGFLQSPRCISFYFSFSPHCFHSDIYMMHAESCLLIGLKPCSGSYHLWNQAQTSKHGLQLLFSLLSCCELLRPPNALYSLTKSPHFTQPYTL